MTDLLFKGNGGVYKAFAKTPACMKVIGLAKHNVLINIFPCSKFSFHCSPVMLFQLDRKLLPHAVCHLYHEIKTGIVVAAFHTGNVGFFRSRYIRQLLLSHGTVKPGGLHLCSHLMPGLTVVYGDKPVCIPFLQETIPLNKQYVIIYDNILQGEVGGWEICSGPKVTCRLRHGTLAQKPCGQASLSTQFSCKVHMRFHRMALLALGIYASVGRPCPFEFKSASADLARDSQCVALSPANLCASRRRLYHGRGMYPARESFVSPTPQGAGYSPFVINIPYF